MRSPKGKHFEVPIYPVVDEGLGHFSYVVDLGDGAALVIDPARLPERQRRLAREHDWAVAWTADTHSHADYISGSTDLAAEGATFLASRTANLEVPHRALDPGDDVALAENVVLRAIATPGHTPDHLAYLLLLDGTPHALFSGGSLMVGAVGRTDLMGDGHAEGLARQLFRSLRDNVLSLPDDLAVYPTHGAGSFCSAPQGAAPATTIGLERTTNPLLQIADEDEFVTALLHDFGSFPTYFRQLPEINRRGPRYYKKLPTLALLPPVDALRELDAGAVIVDVRSIEEFARSHPRGALSNSLRPVFGSWLGWLIPLGTPLVFVCDETTDRDDLVRQCLTIGHEHLVGEIAGGVAGWVGAGLPVDEIPLVVATDMSPRVLDVRQTNEWVQGHLPGATHIELADLTHAIAPGGATTLMCGHGERAMTAASLLHARGATDLSVLVGGPADWQAATGRPLESE